MGKGKKTVSGEVVELRTRYKGLSFSQYLIHKLFLTDGSFEVREKLEAFYTGGQVQVRAE